MREKMNKVFYAIYAFFLSAVNCFVCFVASEVIAVQRNGESGLIDAIYFLLALIIQISILVQFFYECKSKDDGKILNIIRTLNLFIFILFVTIFYFRYFSRMTIL